METSPQFDIDSNFESYATSGPFSSSYHHVYASDSSTSNLSCSSCSTDSTTSSNSTRRSSWEKRISNSSNSKPHKAHDTAWTAIRGLRLREGSVTLAHFKLLCQVGHGDIGNVYLAQLRGTDCIFAMKLMDKEALRQRNKLQRMQNEREILENLDHPFLPTLYAHFDTEKISCLVLEYCPGGDLHSLRQKQQEKRFGLKATIFYAAEVLMALEYLHMMGVIYRDLKPENILVREDGHIMLTDFDLSLKCEVNPKILKFSIDTSSAGRHPLRISRFYGLPSCLYHFRIRPIISCLPLRSRTHSSRRARSSKHTNSSYKPLDSPFRRFYSLPELIAEPIHARSMSFVGTHEYLPPEIISGFGHGSSVDWWTFGIFVYELLFGTTPFKGKSKELTLINIIKQPLRFPDGADIEVGEAARSLIRGLLVKDPRKRLGSARGAAEIKKHRFFRGVNWALIRSAKPPEIPRKNIQQDARKKNVVSMRKHTINAALSDFEDKGWLINKHASELLPKLDVF